jgi:cobalt-zinc-cadmium efflux system outer membrane protein
MRARDWLILFAMAAAAAPTPALAQHGAALPASMREEDIFHHWLANSQEVAAWRNEIGASRFDVLTARIWPNPQLQVSGSTTVQGDPGGGRTAIGAQLAFTLPIFGQVSRRIDAAEANVHVTESNIAAALWQRASDIRHAMLDRIFADARARMLTTNLNELMAFHTIVETRARDGANSQYDVLRVDNAVATLRAALSDAEIERDRAETILLSFIADPSLHAAPISREGLGRFDGPDSEQALIHSALARRPDLELARRGIIAAEASASRWRRDSVPMPTLWIGGQVTRDVPSVVVYGGVGFALPTFDRNQGMVGHAVADADTQRMLVSALEERIRAEVSGSWVARQSATEALQRFRTEGLPLTQSMMDRAQVAYRAGAMSIADLFDAYRAIWEARLQEIALQETMVNAEADLERAAAVDSFAFAPIQSHN